MSGMSIRGTRVPTIVYWPIGFAEQYVVLCPVASVRLVLLGGFVRQRRNVLLAGPPGVGKSHLAQAIGRKLVYMGLSVLYRSIFDAVRDFLHDEAFEGHDKMMTRYLKPDLLILDDMGLKQLPKRSGEYLFEIIMRRHELRSTMMTSNRPLEDWGKLIGDVPAATAILDRLLANAEMLQITGKSYRLRGKRPRRKAFRLPGRIGLTAKPAKRALRENGP